MDNTQHDRNPGAPLAKVETTVAEAERITVKLRDELPATVWLLRAALLKRFFRPPSQG